MDAEIEQGRADAESRRQESERTREDSERRRVAAETDWVGAEEGPRLEATEVAQTVAALGELLERMETVEKLRRGTRREAR